MANARPPLKDEDLRETHDFLVGAITQQARDLGIEPRPEHASQVVQPILRRVEVGHEEERNQAPYLPELHPEQEPAELPEVQPTAPRTTPFGRPRGMQLLPGTEITVEELSPEDLREAKEDPDSHALRMFLRFLRKKPEWRYRFEKIALSTLPQAEKDKKYRYLIDEAVRLYGDPRKQKDRTIYVNVSKQGAKGPTP